MFVLEQLSQPGTPLSELRKPFERYAGVGRDQHRGAPTRTRRSSGSPPRYRARSRIASTASPSTAATWWFNLRPSNTEPLLRLNLEAPTRDECDEHVAEVLALITDALTRLLGRWPSTRGCSRSSPARRTRARCYYFADEDALYNPRLKRRYAVRDGIPIMLIDEAETVDDAEHERLMAKADAEGIGPTFDVRHDVTACSTRSACATRRLALPEQVARRPRPRSSGHRRAARRATVEQRRSCSAWAAAASPATCCRVVAGPFVPGADHGLEGLRAARLRRASARWSSRISFSGNTEETVEARHRGGRARRAASSSVCQAARSAELAGGLGRPRAARARPASRCPRAGLGALAVPPLLVLEEHRAVPRRARVGAGGRRAARAATRPARGRGQPRRRAGPAHRAHDPARLRRRAVGAVAAMRWKCEVNENAKAPAFCNRLPELCHNEVAGWGQHGDVTRQVFTLVEPAPRPRAPADRPPVRAGRRARCDEVVGRHRRGAGRRRRAARPAVRPRALRRLRVACDGRRTPASTPAPSLRSTVHQAESLRWAARGLAAVR